MAKKELLVDLRLAQPCRCARCKYHAGHYYSVILDGSTRQDKAIAITVNVRFVNEQWEIIQRLVRIDMYIVAKFVAGTQLSQVLMESLFTDLQLRGKQVLAMPAHRWCSNKQSSSPQPGSISPEAFMSQMIRWTRGVVYRLNSPLFGSTQHPLAGHNLSFSSRTRTIKDICADQDVCMMFKQSKKL